MREANTETNVLYCPAITRAGERCNRHINAGESFCSQHDPARAEERRRNASRAGRSKPLSESGKIRRDIFVLIEEVRNGEVEPRIANAIAVLANVALGSLRLDMKIRELEDLEARITDLEEVTKRERL
jgi:hypothetical protein